MTARDYLRSRSWLGQKFGLKTMRALMRELGAPQLSFRSVLVAGTNGKGSVSAYLDAALRATSLRVGRYTSPHLVDIRERITVLGKNIGNADFERLVLVVRTRAASLLRKHVIDQHPNHFEILTSAAFLYFQERSVDVAILEVGLGGRLDATNVASPLVSAIVSIDFDHEEYLGRTLALIAREKAGVARKNRVVVVGPMAREAEQSIERVSRARGASMVRALEGVDLETTGAGLSVRTRVGSYAGLRPLPGAHQRTNLLVAIATLEALSASGVDFDLSSSVSAMSGASWPGRLERLAFKGSPYLLDGAHNPAGAQALARYLEETRLRHVLVFGVMKDKHVDEMTASLFPRARVVIATRVRMKRAATTAQLASIARKLGKDVVEEPAIDRALKTAEKELRKGETVVVAGSLYLVGAVRKRLLSKSTRRQAIHRR